MRAGQGQEGKKRQGELGSPNPNRLGIYFIRVSGKKKKWRARAVRTAREGQVL